MTPEDDILPSLYAAVYASPNDVSAKWVLSDALLERGDPRGEFIALQLRPRTKRSELRVDKLLERHRTEFLGALGAVVRPEQQRWEHGFLIGCRATLSGSTVNEPAWAMVRHLTLVGHSPTPPLELTGPHLRSVLELSGVELPELDVIRVSERALPFHVVTLDGPGESDDWPAWALDVVRTLPSCPAVTQLGLRFWRFDPARLEWLWAAPVLSRLRTLELTMPRALVNVTQVTDALRRRSDGPGAVVMRGRTLEVKVKSTDDWSVLSLRVRTASMDAALADAAAMFELMPPDAVTRLDIESDVPVPSSALARLKRLVRRFTALEAITWPEK